MKRRTKIICTIGPATRSPEMIRKLCDAGMNVARLNFSHETHESHRQVIDAIKEVRASYDFPIAIMLDTKGPEIRVGDIQDIEVVEKGRVRLVSGKAKESEIPVNPGFIVDDIEIGVQILFDDGYVRGYIIDKGDGWADVEIENNGVIKRGKGINVPTQLFDLPDMTKQDMKDIEFGCQQGVDFIAASFVNTAKQLLAIREHINNCGGQSIMLIAKIETKLGVVNFDDILQIADGIMIARGDLGVEIFVGQVPAIQKKLIRACNSKAKPVIVATQMLESMIEHSMPTRAEASDVANAIFDSGSALMLSGETAIGKYPVGATRMMHEIILAVEKDFDHRAHFEALVAQGAQDVSSAMAASAVNSGFHLGASAIIACSNSGNTIRHICRFRPKLKIIAVTPSEKTYYQTAMMWGTECYREKNVDIVKGINDVSSYALKRKWVKYGDPIVITLGKPYGVSFTTNTITIESVGNVLVRGIGMKEEEVLPIIGEVSFFLSVDPKKCYDFENKIVVTNRIDDAHIEPLKCAAAIILQNQPYDVFSVEKLGQLYEAEKIPYIFRAEGATDLLNEGDTVRIHPSLGLIFSKESPTEEEMLNSAD